MKQFSTIPQTLVLALGTMLLAIAPVDADWRRVVTNSAENAAKRETSRQVDKMVANAVRCAFDEFKCIEKAQKKGKPVVLTDEHGEIIYDEDGNPVTDPSQLPPQYQQGDAQGSGAKAPPTVNANYDFEAGDRILVFEDYSADNIGDFPRAFEFRHGDVAVIELDGRRVVRLVGQSEFDVPLPETLPEQFTIEFDVWLDRHQLVLVGSPWEDIDLESSKHPKHRFQVSPESDGTGIRTGTSYDAPAAVKPSIRVFVGRFETIRVMVDSQHGKMYVGNDRVANLPRGDFARDRVLRVYFHTLGKAPAYIGPIRVAAGGRDLYDALVADGRVAIHDIHFDTDAATIRRESTATLDQIAQMLETHPDLKLLLEGHTDGTGDFDHNMDLSSRRAESVKDWLVNQRGIDGSRLRCLGLGQTQPQDTNDTEAGRQQNRRVELVKL